jgi:hypothetical protein
MKTQSTGQNLRLDRIPWLSLVILLLAYALVGWNLADYHLFWGLSFCLIASALTFAWMGSEWMSRILGYMSIVLIIATAVSLFITLTLISSLYLTLGFLPILTMLFAWQEMRFWNYSMGSTTVTLAGAALLGTGFGAVLNFATLSGTQY